MEGHLGRHLRAGEIVHHVNGDCSDDRVENLQLTTRREHPSFHKREIRDGIQGSARSKLSVVQRAEVLALVAAGWHRGDIATAYGVTDGAIRYHEKQAILKVGRS
jgi:DNA-binding NarL/FixJ family response regulator